MGSMNRVILIGRLGGDPNERTTNSGTRVSSFSLATDQLRSNRNGTAQSNTEWHRVVAFGKTAEHCSHYLRKGRLVCVEGSLQTRTWEKSPGEKRYFTEVVVSRITFLDFKADDPATHDQSLVEEEEFR